MAVFFVEAELPTQQSTRSRFVVLFVNAVNVFTFVALCEIALAGAEAAIVIVGQAKVHELFEFLEHLAGRCAWWRWCEATEICRIQQCVVRQVGKFALLRARARRFKVWQIYADVHGVGGVHGVWVGQMGDCFHVVRWRDFDFHVDRLAGQWGWLAGGVRRTDAGGFHFCFLFDLNDFLVETGIRGENIGYFYRMKTDSRSIAVPLTHAIPWNFHVWNAMLESEEKYSVEMNVISRSINQLHYSPDWRRCWQRFIESFLAQQPIRIHQSFAFDFDGAACLQVIPSRSLQYISGFLRQMNAPWRT